MGSRSRLYPRQKRSLGINSCGTDAVIRTTPCFVEENDGRSTSIPGVSKIIETIVTEILETGSCQKMDEGDEYFTPPPRSVLELTKIPRLGAKTARTLFQDHGIDSLDALRAALEDGRLARVNGIGKGMIATIRRFLDAQSV